jgi:hypothetical protein
VSNRLSDEADEPVQPGALRLSGMTVPIMLDGPMNRPAFRAYVEQVLLGCAPGHAPP